MTESKRPILFPLNASLTTRDAAQVYNLGSQNSLLGASHGAVLGGWEGVKGTEASMHIKGKPFSVPGTSYPKQVSQSNWANPSLGQGASPQEGLFTLSHFETVGRTISSMR